MPNTYNQDDLIDNQETNLFDFFKIHSVTYGVNFYFLPYAFKLTENLNIRWNEQTVFGRMDPIPTYKGMGRTMTVSFQARQKLLDGSGKPFKTDYNGEELLHDIDHIKKCLYPRYNKSNIMVSPPLFRFYYKSLIAAGENTIASDITNPKTGVLGYITAFSANPSTEPNKIYFPSNKRQYAYPKVFDINFTFTVLNENLVETQQNGVLNNRYFYSYETKNHGHDETQTETPADQRAGVQPSDEQKDALLASALANLSAIDEYLK